MQLINIKRGAGKTKRLVTMVKADPLGVMVVADIRRARRVIEEYQLEESKIISSFETCRLLGMGSRNLYIDDADDILRRLMGPNNTIMAITMSLQE